MYLNNFIALVRDSFILSISFFFYLIIIKDLTIEIEKKKKNYNFFISFFKL